MAQLEVENISLGYDGVLVAAGVSFTLEAGGYLSVIGENGAGKSTLLKALLNLHKPLSGDIRFNGVKRRDLGYLPQQRDVQKDFPASAHEIVLSGCLNGCGLRPFYHKREQALALNNMERLGIASLAKRCYRELSGGQQQRVLLARALCSAKKMIFLDEPAAGLDPDAARDMYEIIAELNRGGLTVVAVSHDVETAIPYSTHVLKMVRNGACFFGAREQYLNQGNHHITQENKS